MTLLTGKHCLRHATPCFKMPRFEIPDYTGHKIIKYIHLSRKNKLHFMNELRREY